jgi:OHCU decarboxylase
MPNPPWTLTAINRWDQAAFVAALGFLFEDSPWIAAQAWARRPFASLDQLHQACCDVMWAATPAAQLALIQAHPDLVGRAARAGTLTPASTREQAAAGLDQLTPDEIATFTRLNAAYWERFGFPFVICARANKKDSILAGFAARLHNTREAEIETALTEIAKIAHLRLRDTVQAV